MPIITRITVNSIAAAIEQDVEAGLRGVRKRVRDRGVEIMRGEVPKRSGLLQAGIRGTVSQYDGTISIIASAIAQRKAQNAVLVLPSGRRKRISLRSGRPYDYAQAVELGTGLFGPDSKLIRPKRGLALLIEVDQVPPGEAYVLANGKKYIFRKYSRGQKPNDFIGRTIVKLTPEIERILTEEIEKA
jgi:hypothetical protein